MSVLVWILLGFSGAVLFLLFPRRQPPAAVATLVLAVGVLARLLFLPQEPDDDVYRYLWEGRMVAQGANPYAHPPDSQEAIELAPDDPYRPLVNHPSSSALYPPLVLLVFAGVTRVCYAPIAIKILIALLDLGVLVVLMGLLRQRDLDLRWAGLAAFNPLLLYSFAGQAHYDAMQNLLAVAALGAYGRRRWILMYLLLGAAIQCKYFIVVAAPFFLRRDNWRYAPFAAVSLFLPCLPFIGSDLRPLAANVWQWSIQRAFNGSMHGVLRWALGGIAPASLVTGAIFALVLLVLLWKLHPAWNRRFRDDPAPGFFAVTGALLLLAPTVHFWFLPWMVPWLVLYPSAAWAVLCLTSSVCLIPEGYLHATGQWRLPLAASLFEWLPFYFLLLRELRLGWRHLRVPAPAESVRSVSVIVPAKNEEDTIGRCVEAARADPCVIEVLVADGGSTDGTVAAATAAGATPIRHDLPPDRGGGRGGQIRAGLAAARGDLAVVLHADTLLPPGACQAMVRALNRRPTTVGGALGAIFDHPGWRFRLIEWLNDFRTLALGVSFGDQVQFFRRRLLADTLGFPDLPLMEDVELSLRLRQIGRTEFLFRHALVSPRRWERGGFRHALRVIALTAEYLLRRPWSRPDAAAMYRRYYGS